MAAAGDVGRAGDSVANATHDLYRQYGKQIYAYCLHQLRSREEAEDAVQTTFLNAFRGLQRGTTTKFEQAWLYKIAQNVCIARRSSSGKRLRLEIPDDFEILEEVVPSGSSATDSDTLELMGLETALEQMPENQRRAILLREWQGLSYREIADQLDLSQGAVEMLIFRARRTLALALEQPAAEKRRTGKAKTGFSFGSLIAAMKGLFSTGATLKMAAVVATTAAVIGTNVVHSVVHVASHHARPHSAAAAAQQPIQADATVAAVRNPLRLVSRVTHNSSSKSSEAAAARAARWAAHQGSGRKPIVVQDTGTATPSGGSAPVTATDSGSSSNASAGSSVAIVAASSSAKSSSSSTTRAAVAPSSGAHHAGGSTPAPTSTGTPGDTTGTPHQHGPHTSGPTSATSSSSNTSSAAAAAGDGSQTGSGPVSVGDGPIGYSTGSSQANTAGNGIRGGGSTSGGGDGSTATPSGQSGDGSTGSTGTSSAPSGGASSGSSGDGSGGGSSSSSSGSSDSSGGHGNGNGSGNGGGNGNGNGHGHGHHGGGG